MANFQVVVGNDGKASGYYRDSTSGGYYSYGKDGYSYIGNDNPLTSSAGSNIPLTPTSPATPEVKAKAVDVTPSGQPKGDSAYDAALAKLGDYKNREASLTADEYKDYLSSLSTLNKGHADYDATLASQKEAFKSALSSRLNGKFGLTPEKISNIADQAAQRFLVERNSGSQGIKDFVIEKAGLEDSKEITSTLGDLNPNSFLPSVGGPKFYDGEYQRVNALAEQAKKSFQQADRQKELDNLSATQRGQSGTLFQQALEAFRRPLPTFTPELSAAALNQLQEQILHQGQTALSQNEAGFANRGLTGSSIEAFGQGTTQGEIAKQFANSTLQFLLKSGESGQQNRQFLANQLFTQAQAMLGAGQQTQGAGIGYELGVGELGARQNQLAAQIAQFNQSMSENQRQFNAQQEFQKSQAGENMALLMQQLSQPGKKGSLMVPGAALGAGIGALGLTGLGATAAVGAAPATGGLSLGLAALLGGAGGAGLGGLADYFGGGS